MHECDPDCDLPSILAPADAPDDSTPSHSNDLSKSEPTFKIIPADPGYFKEKPEPRKKYSHRGKRHRSITEDLFRCTFVTKVISDELSCGALLWKNKPHELREHLLTHLALSVVSAMTDEQVVKCYQQAKSFTLAPMPDDLVHGITKADLDEDTEYIVEGETPDE
jgi:hypothetical protein